MNSDETVRERWQASVTEADLPSLDEVRAGADKFYRKVRLRNRIEYVACTIAVMCFTIYSFTLEHILQRIGSAMVVAGTLIAAWQLHRRASAVPPESGGDMPILDFTRMQLARQRDALTSIFWWYILPFLPGLAVMVIGNGQNPATAANVPIWLRWVALAGMAAVFGGVWWLNQRAARKLQKHIDEIDALKR